MITASDGDIILILLSYLISQICLELFYT